MRSPLLDLVLKDLRRPWDAWPKIALTALVGWLVLWAHLGITRAIPPPGFEVTVWVTSPWVSVLTATVALARRATSKIVAVSLLVACIALGWPIFLFSLLWAPELLLSWCSSYGVTFHHIGLLPAVVLFWVILGVGLAACLWLVSPRRGERSGAGAHRE